jgi:hypothetical protein
MASKPKTTGAVVRKAAKSRRDLLSVSRPPLLVDGSDQEFRALVHDLMAFSHHLEACRDGFGARVGITGVQYEIFMVVRAADIADAGRSLGVSQVAERLHRSGAFITLEVNKLVAKKILKKSSDPTDGRRVILQLDAVGERIAQTLAPVQQQVNDVLFAYLDRARFKQLRALASALATSGDRASALVQYLVREADSHAA